MIQTDLFGAPTLPGFVYRPNLIDEAEEAALVDAIDAAGLEPFRFQGWLGKRRTRTFGWRYDFDDASFAPAEPLPDWLLPIRERAAAVAGLPVEEFVHVLLTRYDPGAGIGWHRDRPQFEHVVGISLGAMETMRFRRRREDRRFDRFDAELAPRSAYLLTGEARHVWEHSIAPVETRRWSITFRSLSAKGKLSAP